MDVILICILVMLSYVHCLKHELKPNSITLTSEVAFIHTSGFTEDNVLNVVEVMVQEMSLSIQVN